MTHLIKSRLIAVWQIGMLVVTLTCSGVALAVEQAEGEQPAVEAPITSSIVIAPVVNHSVDVDAPNTVLSTLPIPLAGRGFYVFPVNTTKIMLEREGLYEADVVHQQDPGALAALFGADAILYVVINRWEAQYAVLSTRVVVDFSYRLVSNTGETLWSENQTLSFEPNQGNSGNPMADLLASVVVSAMENTSPRYLSLTEQANANVFRRSPTGPYYVKGKR